MNSEREFAVSVRVGTLIAKIKKGMLTDFNSVSVQHNHRLLVQMTGPEVYPPG
jgi:hypothetical protein